MTPDLPARVRLLIVEDGRIALIRRRRTGHTYYVLPGGGVEPGETVEEAAHREAMEELGVEIEFGEKLGEEAFRGQRFLFYRARITGGEFGTGEWPDIAERPADERANAGTYEACWIPLDELSDLDVSVAIEPVLEGRPIVRMERLDHLVLTVADIDRTVHFYRRVLGMHSGVFGDGRMALHLGSQKINLHQAGNELAPAAARPAPGSADLCLISSVPIPDVLDQLAREGVPVELGPVRRTGALGEMTSVYVRDPDGNLVEIATYDEGGSLA